VTSTISTPRVVRFPRFDRTERIVHWTNATLFLILLFTGASLKLGFMATLVAHRETVKTIHVYSGLLLPIPIVLGIVLHSGAQLRRDLGRLNRWTKDDKRWWSSRTRPTVQLGKFNPGQKLNATFIGASIVVMLMTGSIMKWFKPFPDSWRTGATFVHDTTWLVLCFVIAGHILFAFRDYDSLRGMVAGWVPERWARRERPKWWAEVVAARDSASAGAAAHIAADASSDVATGAQKGVGEAGAGAGEMPVGDPVDGGARDGRGGREL
jgi:formate dehydrogenase subunit gamma